GGHHRDARALLPPQRRRPGRARAPQRRARVRTRALPLDASQERHDRVDEHVVRKRSIFDWRGLCGSDRCPGLDREEGAALWSGPMRTLAILVVLFASAGVVHAKDECKAKCDDWRSSCTKACTEAPVPEDCKGNCGITYDKCMSDCGEPP